MISNAISQTRSLARGLDPVEVETIGLVAALQNLAAETERFFGIVCVFQCNDTKLPIDPQVGLALYRIAQESIHNANVHGEARRILIHLEIDPQNLCLRIEDNGLGFESEHRQRSGMGLRVMEYRAGSIGGSLRISSQVGKGTEIQCLLKRNGGNLRVPVTA